jgi:hypothetical protein
MTKNEYKYDVDLKNGIICATFVSFFAQSCAKFSLNCLLVLGNSSLRSIQIQDAATANTIPFKNYLIHLM